MKQVCGIRGAPRLTEACPRHAWQPQGCCACVGQAVVCRASSLHLSLLRQKSEKMLIEDIHLALAPNPRVLLVPVRLLVQFRLQAVGGLLQ